MLIKFRHILIRVLGRKLYEKVIFYLKNGYVPDLDIPETFNEIIASRKIHQQVTDLQILCADKLKVRDYVSDKIGSNYLTNLHDVIYQGDNLNLEKWPKQVVLKANHASGKKFIKIITNTSNINHVKLRAWIHNAIKNDYGIITNEFWYNYIQPRCILVEEKLNPGGDDLKDYKFMMVEGEVFFIQVDQGRFTNHTRNLYSEHWRELEFTTAYPKGQLTDKPKNLALMTEIAKKLAVDFEVCRVDLYEDEFSRVKFGEITFSPDAGWGTFKPRKFDRELGLKISFIN
jgi:hypothetical protein